MCIMHKIVKLHNLKLFMFNLGSSGTVKLKQLSDITHIAM